MPNGAVAVGLRTKGMLGGKPHWFGGELMEAERAARMYEELTGIGGYYPKDPALLSWRTPSLLALQVFPVAPMSSKEVEYTYRLPVTYSGGRYRVSVNLADDQPSPVAVAARALGGDGRCSCSVSQPTSCGVPPPGFQKSAHVAVFVVARLGDTNGLCNRIRG